MVAWASSWFPQIIVSPLGVIIQYSSLLIVHRSHSLFVAPRYALPARIIAVRLVVVMAPVFIVWFRLICCCILLVFLFVVLAFIFGVRLLSFAR